MAHQNRILRSINGFDAATCVDFFMRPDGSFGFEEFRRDPEDSRGWFPVGGYGAQRFLQEEAAFAAALASIVWLPLVTGRITR